MPAVQIAPNVYWVGAVDPGVRDFHGYKTPVGTTYNAYLIIDEHITLLDSVRHGFSDQLFANISEVIDPAKIDTIICNHGEPDHAGSLAEVVQLCPNAPVYCSPNAQKTLKSYFGAGSWNLKVVKSGDTLSLGKYTVHFLLTPMVHWPDSMASYIPQLKLLFSNDGFGQHIATEERFADEVGYDCVYDRSRDYYANIIMPLSQPVKNTLAEVAKLDVEIIAPMHGAIWRERQGIQGIVQRYIDWTDYKTKPELAVIAYDTMWHSTEAMAETLAQQLRDQGKQVSVFSLRRSHISQVVAAAMEAETIYIGSATLNRGMMPQVAALLCYMKGLGFRNRVGRAFGSFGWSGEAPAQIDAALKELGFDTTEPWRLNYKPE